MRKMNTTYDNAAENSMTTGVQTIMAAKVLLFSFLLLSSLNACSALRWESPRILGYVLVSSEVEGQLGPIRAKRQIGPDPPCAHVTLPLRNKKLQLCLRKADPSSGLIINESGKVELVTLDHNETFSFQEIYSGLVEGYVQGDPYSSVNGYIFQSHFYGSIRQNGSTFWVENANEMEPFLKIQTDHQSSENAIVFQEKDLILTPMNSTSAFPFLEQYRNATRKKRDESWSDGNINSDTLFKGPRDYAVLCSLSVIADDKFYKFVAKNNTMLAIDRIKYYIREVDAVFRTTDFDRDETPDNVGLEIDLVKVYTSRYAAGNYINEDKYPTVASYLQSFSKFDFSRHCLGIGFTHRIFDQSHGGLAFPARPPPSEKYGGICQSRRDFRFSAGQSQSTNSLIISTRSTKFSVLPTQAVILNLLHTLGHSFGARDDDTLNPSCLSGGIGLGSYIMAPNRQPGERLNNWQFSACSVMRMKQVLESQGRCLLRVYRAFCGNGLVEKHEQCDCGTVQQCGTRDACCGPRGSPTECQLRTDLGFQCSPSQGPCCSAHCRWKDLSHLGIDCSVSEDLCSSQVSCPKGLCKNPPTGTMCGTLRPVRGTGCFQERCQSIECLRLGLEECQCPPSTFDMCATCCRNGNGQCQRSVQLTDQLVDDMQELLDRSSSYLSLEEVLGQNGSMWATWSALSVFGGSFHNKEVERVDVLSLDGPRAVLAWPLPPDSVVTSREAAAIFQRHYCLFFGSRTSCRATFFRFWPERSYCVLKGVVAKCYHDSVCRLPSRWTLPSNPLLRSTYLRSISSEGNQLFVALNLFYCMILTALIASN